MRFENCLSHCCTETRRRSLVRRSSPWLRRWCTMPRKNPDNAPGCASPREMSNVLLAPGSGAPPAQPQRVGVHRPTSALRPPLDHPAVAGAAAAAPPTATATELLLRAAPPSCCCDASVGGGPSFAFSSSAPRPLVAASALDSRRRRRELSRLAPFRPLRSRSDASFLRIEANPSCSADISSAPWPSGATDASGNPSVLPRPPELASSPPAMPTMGDLAAAGAKGINPGPPIAGKTPPPTCWATRYVGSSAAFRAGHKDLRRLRAIPLHLACNLLCLPLDRHPLGHCQDPPSGGAANTVHRKRRHGWRCLPLAVLARHLAEASSGPGPTRRSAHPRLKSSIRPPDIARAPPRLGPRLARRPAGPRQSVPRRCAEDDILVPPLARARGPRLALIPSRPSPRSASRFAVSLRRGSRSLPPSPSLPPGAGPSRPDAPSPDVTQVQQTPETVAPSEGARRPTCCLPRQVPRDGQRR